MAAGQQIDVPEHAQEMRQPETQRKQRRVLQSENLSAQLPIAAQHKSFQFESGDLLSKSAARQQLN